MVIFCGFFLVVMNDCFNSEGNVIGLRVSPFLLYLLNQLTFDFEFLRVCGS